MTIDFPGLILKDCLYSVEDLVVFSNKMIDQETPEWERSIYRFILEFLDEKEYIAQKSSGTTGEPKEFKLSKQALIESATRTCDKLNLKFGDKALLCLPVDYIAGKMMVVRALVCGLNLFWEEPSSMPDIAKYGKLDFCAMVPIQVYNSFSNYEFVRNIKNLIIGGAELRSEVLAMFKDIENNVFETYGMAETCSHVALRKISGKNPDEYYQALPGVEFEMDERNCLIVKAEYLGGRIVTNDVVDVIDSKQFVWKGRFDHLINTGGLKVKPEEIEAEVSQIVDLEIAVLGTPDKELGQAITLVLESSQKLDVGELKEKLAEVLPKHHMPRNYYFVDKLPRNNAFKIDRIKLFEQINNL